MKLTSQRARRFAGQAAGDLVEQIHQDRTRRGLKGLTTDVHDAYEVRFTAGIAELLLAETWPPEVIDERPSQRGLLDHGDQ